MRPLSLLAPAVSGWLTVTVVALPGTSGTPRRKPGRRGRRAAWLLYAGLLYQGGLPMAAAEDAVNDELMWESVKGCTVAEEVAIYVGLFEGRGKHLAEARECLKTLGREDLLFGEEPAAVSEHAEQASGLSLEQEIQAALGAAGFDAGPADGKFGPKTRRAIRAWQLDNGYEGTGFFEPDQIMALLSAAPQAVAPESSLAVMLEPKCAELPGQYLNETHAECWQAIENQPGCFLWRTHYHSDDQDLRWTGPCRDGVAEGHGTYSVRAGSEHSPYEGVGTLAHGRAVGRWIDTWSGGSRCEVNYFEESSGEWTCTYADGARYEGEWRDGNRHGNGTFWYANGGRYEGDWRDGNRHGYGTLRYANGDLYEGKFREGNRHGFGTLTWIDGNRYQGNWRDDVRSGMGTHVFAIGGEYHGAWQNDRPHGYGTHRMASGTVLQGQWRAGCLSNQVGWAALNTTKAACGF